MKSTVFEVKGESVKCTVNPKYPSASRFEYLWHIPVPILQAYSIEYFSVQLGIYTALSSSDDKIEGNEIILASQEPLQKIKSVFVIMHYHGIRDYSLLFPWVTDSSLRGRLGLFYEEAEKNFDQGAWLSFALMCGAIFEGMLFAKLDHPTDNIFFNMIGKSYELRIIDKVQKDIMHNVRLLRNLVHGNRFETPYITRVDAMDIRTTLNTLIKTFCSN